MGTCFTREIILLYGIIYFQGNIEFNFRNWFSFIFSLEGVRGTTQRRVLNRKLHNAQFWLEYIVLWWHVIKIMKLKTEKYWNKNMDKVFYRYVCTRIKNKHTHAQKSSKLDLTLIYFVLKPLKSIDSVWLDTSAGVISAST